MPTTSNFGWTTPADTDLVKDGAAAIRTLGNGIDSSLVDLKGGTTGQILSKASNADMDFTFITPNVGDITEVQAGVGISVASGTGPIPVITNSSTDLITTAGDLLYGTAADTVARLGIGTAKQVLAVNSGATAPEWVAPSGMTLLSTTTLSGASTTISTINQTYVDLNVYVYGITLSADATIKIEPNAAASSVWSVINYANVTDGPAAGGFNLTSTNGTLELESTDSNNAWSIVFANYASTASQKPISAVGGYVNESGSTGGFSNFGYYKAATAISSLKFTTSTGTFSGGTVLIYGAK